MIRKPHNAKGPSTQAGEPAPRWRSLAAALVFVLLAAGAGRAAPARAAPDNPADIGFEVEAFPEAPPPLCTYQTLKIYVNVNRTINKTINDKEWVIPRGEVTGVKVRGTVTNSNIGTLTPPETQPDSDLAALGAGDADFLFTAKKAGTTTLVFNANVPGAWTGSAEALAAGKTYPARKAQIEVKVIPCKVKVNTISHWNAGMTIVGTIDDAVMTRDNAGHFTGSANVSWVTSILCGISSPIAPSTAELTGDVDDNGQLVGKVTFGPISSSGGGSCAGVGVSTSNSGTPDPLTLSASSEGASVHTQSQGFPAKNGLFTGSATIVVIPEEDQAAAFNPGAAEVSAVSPFRGIGLRWDEFPGLYGALTALP